jgi:hypothetical protein
MIEIKFEHTTWVVIDESNSLDAVPLGCDVKGISLSDVDSLKLEFWSSLGWEHTGGQVTVTPVTNNNHNDCIFDALTDL